MPSRVMHGGGDAASNAIAPAQAETAIGTGDPTTIGSAGSGSRVSGDGDRAAAAGVRYGINPKPPYPLVARQARAEGTVLLRVLVRSDGAVAAVEVVESSGHEELDDSAARTVRERWYFSPARRNDVPIESWVKVPIRFVLGEAGVGPPRRQADGPQNRAVTMKP